MQLFAKVILLDLVATKSDFIKVDRWLRVMCSAY